MGGRIPTVTVGIATLDRYAYITEWQAPFVNGVPLRSRETLCA
jgi:hypothetical protein